MNYTTRWHWAPVVFGAKDTPRCGHGSAWAMGGPTDMQEADSRISLGAVFGFRRVWCVCVCVLFWGAELGDPTNGLCNRREGYQSLILTQLFSGTLFLYFFGG